MNEIQLELVEDEQIFSLKYGLTQEFFEKILEYESLLKEKFDPKILFELINLYSKAIKYYESINDNKFIIYNQALNYLFELPEAEKFLEGKDLSKIYRKKELINKFKLIEKIITEEKVKNFINNKIKEENIKTSIKYLYNSDINKQKNNLTKMIEAKRAKYKNKKDKKREIDNIHKENNDINEINTEKININDIKLESVDNKNKENINNHQLNVDNNNEKINKEYENGSNLNGFTENFGEDKEIQKNRNSDNDNNVKNENIQDRKNELVDYDNIQDIDLKQSIKLTNKSRFSEKISKNFDIYFDSYYEYFINNNLDLIINEINENSDETSKKLCNSAINFMNKIKDMEYLLKDKNNEEAYKNEIQKMINDLKQQQNKNIQEIMMENDEKYNDIEYWKDKYIVNNSIFKEKFKLDTTKLLNTFIFK